MSTEKKRSGSGPFWSAVLWMALPVLAAAAFALWKWGPTLRDMIHVLIKMVVTS